MKIMGWMRQLHLSSTAGPESRASTLYPNPPVLQITLLHNAWWMQNYTLNQGRIESCLIVHDRECMNCFFKILVFFSSYPHSSCVSSSSFQLEPSRTIVTPLALSPNPGFLGDLQVEYSSGQVCKCVPGRPIGLTQARVSNVVL